MKKRILFTLTVAAVCYMAWIMIKHSSALVVKEVVCGEGFESVCFQVEKALLGEKIYKIKSRQLAKRVLQVNPLLQAVDIKKSLKGKISINIVEREPLAVLVTQQKTFLLDKEACAFKETTASSSATPIYADLAGEVSLGSSNFPSGVLSAVDLLSAASETGLDILSIKDRRSYLLAQLTKNIVAWFPLEKDLTGQTYSQLTTDVTTILNRAQLERKKFQKIDLRYGKITIE
jgi:cell division septal protein FtsQ